MRKWLKQASFIALVVSLLAVTDGGFDIIKANTVTIATGSTIAGNRVSRGLVALKTSDTTITSDNTLNDDAQLLLVLADSGSYSITGKFFVQSGTTPDIQFAFNGVSLVTTHCIWGGAGASTSATTCAGAGVLFATSGAEQVVTVTGNVLVGSSAGDGGTLQLQWAQNTSDPGNTTVFSGSMLQADKIN